MSNATLVPVKHKSDPVFTLRHAVNRLFDEFAMGPSWPRMLDDMTGYIPRVDIKDAEKEVIISAEIPGVKVEDIELKIVGDSLVLSGEKKEEKEHQDAHSYRIERSYGSFQRVLPLPPGVDRDAIEATTTDGVLRVRLPKTKAAQQPAKKIEVKNG